MDGNARRPPARGTPDAAAGGLAMLLLVTHTLVVAYTAPGYPPDVLLGRTAFVVGNLLAAAVLTAGVIVRVRNARLPRPAVLGAAAAAVVVAVWLSAELGLLAGSTVGAWPLLLIVALAVLSAAGLVTVAVRPTPAGAPGRPGPR